MKKLIIVTVLAVLTLGFVGPVAVFASQATVDLDTAANFVILSEAQITDASPSTSLITGDVGVHPAAGTLIQDISCSTVTGTIYDNNAGYTGGFDADVTCLITDATLLGNAVQDMDDARLDAQGRTPNDVVNDTNEAGSGTLNGLTFNPGLHTWSTGVSITGDITLDGDINDVWIFQIAGTLSVDSGVVINLTGGAQASNIFWVVSGAVTLGTSSTFEGNILAVTGIATLADSVVHGRLLAQTAITLDGTSNTVTIPVLVTDTTAPVITLVGSTPVNLTVGDTYSDAGATALDDIDGNITGSIITVNSVNTAIAGTYTVTYNVTDSSTNSAIEVTRTVVVSAVPVPTPTPTPSSGGGGSTTYCTEERTTFCRPVSNQTLEASTDGQVLGAFSPEENQAQIDSIRDSLISLLKQLINLLQAQIIVMQATPGFPNTGFAPR